MAKISGIGKAFASYGAKLANRMWAVSAPIEGAMVLSLWAHKFKRGMVYEDRLSRWSGAGNTLFRQHLAQAVADELPIRLVIATCSDPESVDRGEDASKFKNTFAVRSELIGEVEHFDGDEFRIKFRAA
ncbi:MAG: hypothetical protein ACOH1P_08190 [Lysobacter sp.]